MKLKNIMLSGRSQKQKDNILCDPIHVKWSGNTTSETINQWLLPGGWEQGVTITGHERYFWMMEIQ